ncbi:RagB/SusD family nutrient uptake outer membrane protein [Pinibacter soli]|uniref:RagB/SusD family nutrient uptake outer membrane protein n=1 Tax=Pinibacter soli TaxID=3044211 RepID=A0ABT6RA53_9BACT|nr:RagB/SusD family nutrient uptake outer membrane protein [Pinibacter soli]MDI3319452.1 RagB/SusD family nutrient uptake outer membrane protein [Pinibacter soli]
MKKLYMALTGLVIFSAMNCKKDYLDVIPPDKIDAQAFFNNATDLQVYTNGFYDQVPLPYGTIYTVYTDDASSDNILPLQITDRVKGARVTPVARNTGGWSFSSLRSINYFLENYGKCPDTAAKKQYGGIARYFRAYFYYDKVKTFGDVPLYTKVLTADDPDLYKPRDSRTLVMDTILADINYAIANIPKTVQLNTITGYTALALKARICLYEGTWRKYHGMSNYETLLNEAASAAETLMNSGAYKLYTAGGAGVAYRNLFARVDQDVTETILARDYSKIVQVNGVNYFMTSATGGAYGIPKDLINSYLMKDGTRYTDIPGYQTKQFYDEMQNRDPRLTQTTAGPDFAAYNETAREPVNLSITTTGYRVIKALSTRDQWVSNGGYSDFILFRYAEALLVYAEAKAELGTLTQADLDKSVNLLRARAGMPNMNMAAANANPDPYLLAQYPNVEKGVNKGVILEIRRERRIEMFNEGLRWDDLMRWKEGKKLEQPMVGIYFPSLGSFDFNNDGKTDVYLHNGNASGAPAGTSSVVNVTQKALTNGTSGNFFPLKGITITFDENKDYLYPIPSEDITLNPKLLQNPGWK